jgi:glycosyltransferase involved in cell wall biosynthesis
VRILLWHGWLLEGSGSNVYTSRVARALVEDGHEVVILCQEQHADRYSFIRATGAVGPGGVSRLTSFQRPKLLGSRGAILLRPEIGALLPVFVIDEYEGFEVKRFVDLTDDELQAYVDRNVEALTVAASWFQPELVIAGHAVPGALVARRALGRGHYVAKIHGSDIEYAIRVQDRYLTLAREGLDGARAVIGATSEVLGRMIELAPGIRGRTRAVPPGVDVEAFRPRGRSSAVTSVATALLADPETGRGRPPGLDQEVREALRRRDGDLLDALAGRYDQTVPDPAAASTFQALTEHRGPLVGYFGKLIPPKGVEILIQAFALLGRTDARCLVVGFGLFREWLQAMAVAIDEGDADGTRWLFERSGTRLELTAEQVVGAAGSGSGICFTGRLDHRYAPAALAAMDVLVVPSVLSEAFGMVAAEGAAAGALPLVARHSGLAELATALEAAAESPGLFSFQPGPGSVRRLATALERLLDRPADERRELRAAVSSFVAREWTWGRTAARIIAAGTE